MLHSHSLQRFDATFELQCSQPKHVAPVKPISSKRLVVAIVAISVASTAAAYLGQYESWPLRTRQFTGYSAFGLNCVIAVLGFWTRERAAWVAYLGVSLLALFLLSVATPLNSLWMLMRAVFNWLG